MKRIFPIIYLALLLLIFSSCENKVGIKQSQITSIENTDTSKIDSNFIYKSELDLVSKYAVLSYDISRAKWGTEDLSRYNSTDKFYVPEWQIVHIEPVPKECYEKGSYYIPFLMRGTGGFLGPIQMTIANPHNIALFIEEFTIEYNEGKEQYDISIWVKKCSQTEDQYCHGNYIPPNCAGCKPGLIISQCKNCQDDGITLGSKRRINIKYMDFPEYPEEMHPCEGVRYTPDPVKEEGKICRDFSS